MTTWKLLLPRWTMTHHIIVYIRLTYDSKHLSVHLPRVSGHKLASWSHEIRPDAAIITQHLSQKVSAQLVFCKLPLSLCQGKPQHCTFQGAHVCIWQALMALISSLRQGCL